VGLEPVFVDGFQPISLGHLRYLNFKRGQFPSKTYSRLAFYFGIRRRPKTMAKLYFFDDPEVWRSKPIGIYTDDDTSLTIVANAFAGGLLDVMGPFFWAALFLTFVFAQTTPH
jgi:hypothetical protein